MDTIELGDIETIQHLFEDISCAFEETDRFKLRQLLGSYDFDDAMEALKEIVEKDNINE